MTELEQARKHLGDVRCELSFVRQQGGSDWGVRMSENDVLAALSWVWDAQCRAVGLEITGEEGTLFLAHGGSLQWANTAHGVTAM